MGNCKSCIIMPMGSIRIFHSVLLLAIVSACGGPDLAVLGEPVPLPVRTGVTDLEYSEIVAGLDHGDEVLLLPSASLFEQQEALQRFITERFSSSPFQ